MKHRKRQSSKSKISRSTKLTTNRVNLLIVIASSALSILLCSMLAEVFFRGIEPKSPPGTTFGKPVQTNVDGFRDRDFAIPKPADIYRVLVLGDSFTWGWGLDVDETIPKLIEKDLTVQSAASHVEVINASDPGANTVEQLMLLKDKGLKYEPDMILVIYNLNDIEYKPELAAIEYDAANVVPVVELDPGEDITKFSKNKGVRGFIMQIEERSAFVRFLVPRVGSVLRERGLIDSVEFSWVATIFHGYTDINPGWIESKNALREISEIARNGDIEFVVAVYPLLNELDNYGGVEAHMTIRGFCIDAQIKCVDLLEVFEDTPERSYFINYADSHPNAKAHQLVTEFLLPIIYDYITR